MDTLPTPAAPLRIITTVSAMRAHTASLLASSTLHAFVPTMGALHSGHLSLLTLAASRAPSVTISIFVNPAQFSPTEDLAVYPRTLPSDLLALETLNASLPAHYGRVEAIFLPSVAEMYPAGIPLDPAAQKGAFVAVQPLGARLEGVTRPGFFRGVATVVTKLLNVVKPQLVVFGQKDVQQTVVVRQVVRDLLMDVEVVVGETGREGSGLAKSSRNVYLGERRRERATVVWRSLRDVEEAFEAGERGAEVLRRKGREVLEGESGKEGVSWEVEYFSIADREEMEELEVVPDEGAVVSVAIRMLPSQEGEGVVRLLDNIILGA